MRKGIFIILFFILFIFSCKKTTKYSIIPEIKLQTDVPIKVTATSTKITSETPSLKFRITDGDGDITGNGNIIFINTKTLDSTLVFDMPTLPSGVDGSKGINASFFVDFTKFIVFDSTKPKDTLNYNIHVFDQAGHYSNTVLAGPIYVN